MKTLITSLIMVLVSISNVFAADYVVVSCKDPSDNHLTVALSIDINNDLDKNIRELCPLAIRRNAELKDLNVTSTHDRGDVLKYEMIQRNQDGSRANALRNIWVYR